jgi:hypothetical protein
MTCVAVSKAKPVIVTVWLPRAGPLVGETAWTAGAGVGTSRVAVA